MQRHGNSKKFTVDDLREAASSSCTFFELYTRLGYTDLPSIHVRKKIRAIMDEEGISFSHFVSHKSTLAPKTRHTYESLAPVVEKAKSYTDVLRLLNLRIAGSNMRNIKNAIQRFNIPTGHFSLVTNEPKYVGYRKGIKERWDDLLSGNIKEELRSQTLRRLMDHAGKPYICVICSLAEWMGKPIRLEVDHRNGDRYDNSDGNLRWLCPNCHSQTETFGSRNRVSLTGQSCPRE